MELSEHHRLGPGGVRHKSAFHQIHRDQQVRIPESGIIERHQDDGQVEVQQVELEQIPAATTQPEPGWIGWAGWTNDTGRKLTRLSGVVTVPESPARESGQTVFLFLGLQAAQDDPSQLFQPVLQWGPSAAGGGEYWGLSCWYLKDEMIVFSGLEQVDPGDRIHVSMSRHDLGPRIRWTARAEVADDDVLTELHVLQDLDLGWCYAALEAYGPDGMACDMYPAAAGTRFDDLCVAIDDDPHTPAWEPKVLVDDCGQGVDVLSAVEVVLRYRDES